MAATSLFLTGLGGAPIVDGVMNNLFSDGTVGDGIDYVMLEVRNTGTGSFTGGRLWLSVDLGGGALAVAVATAAVAAIDDGWPVIDAATLTYSFPASQATGLTVPTLAPLQKALFAARRDLSTATPARPGVNRVNVGGTVPIGF